jgi:mRNA-degrading endonuclease RelE of RelBE toxin-antitoxin system
MSSERIRRLTHVYTPFQVTSSALDELASHPMKGKPLQEELAGLWSLRVSHYRIIYQLDEASITVIFLGLRRTVYERLREVLLK